LAGFANNGPMTGEPLPPVYVYMVECADRTLYTGWTTNLERRLKTHNAGRGARYTKTRGPVRLVFVEPQPNRHAALKREAQLKRMSRQQKLKLIEDCPAALFTPVTQE